jgi:hypothetical protein
MQLIKIWFSSNNNFAALDSSIVISNQRLTYAKNRFTIESIQIRKVLKRSGRRMLLADDRWRQNSGCHHQNIIKSDFGT